MSAFEYTFDQLINPCLQAHHKLGGSGTNSEIETEVSMLLKLKEKQVNEIHRGNVTKLDYCLRWARNYLKRAGILENSARGVWSLTKKGKSVKKVDATKIVRAVAALTNANRKRKKSKELQADAEEEVNELNWQEELPYVVKKIQPAAFERLSQLLLRELGFKNVEVTGKSGDGGIDGKGILNIGSVISFHVVFQCKRYRHTVTPTVVRDFRGALQGRADKGLLITTGAFTREARLEAQRDGALAIDLMAGNELAQKLKDLGLGVKIEQVQRVQVNKDCFSSVYLRQRGPAQHLGELQMPA